MSLSAIQPYYIPAVSITVLPGITITNLDSTGLRIEWLVMRDNTNKPDTGTVTVYNLSPATIGLIYDAWRASRRVFDPVPIFSISIGWNRLPEQLMVGDIIDLIPQRRTPTDVLTVFQIGDGTQRTRDQTVGRDFANVNLVTVLDYLITLPPAGADAGGGGLGLLFPADSKALVQQAAAEIPLQNWGNITKGMSTVEAVNQIMDTLGLEWRIHNNAFIALRGGLILRPGPTIRPQTGLIDYSPRDDGGIEFTAVADTRLEPGIRTTVLDNLGRPIGSPSYRVESVAFQGNTDENSIVRCLGRRPIGIQEGATSFNFTPALAF